MTITLVSVGDSFTEGLCDDLRPDGEFRGWADRVAQALARDAAGRGDSVEYANLAVRGKLLDQIVDDQLPLAAAMQPTVMTFHAGANDVLRPKTDVPSLFGRYEEAVRRAREMSPQVVLFTSIGRAGGTGRLANNLATRFGQFNANVREVAQRHDVVLVDLERAPVLTDRRLWWDDRLHLNADGHARVAAAVLEHLGITDEALLGGPAGWWQEPLPPAPPTSFAANLATDARWVRRHFVPWVGRRLRGVSSGDGRQPKDTTPRLVAP